MDKKRGKKGQRIGIFAQMLNQFRYAMQDTVSLNIILLIIMLCGLGCMIVFSASSFTALNDPKIGNMAYYVERQIAFFVLGFIAMMICMCFDYKWLKKIAILGYFASIGLIFLLKTPLGIEANGAVRWIDIGPVQFQVAELVKIFLIIFLSYVITRQFRKMNRIGMIFILWIATAILAMLVLVISSNLSTALILLGMVFVYTFVSSKRKLAHLLIAGALGVLVLFGISELKKQMPSSSELAQGSFRLGRIAAWLEPEQYADTVGYQVVQSLYAAGTGGLFGKGLGQSVQKLGQIPEAHNDMIFAIYCEELGVFGVVLLLILFVVLFYYILRVVVESGDRFGKLLAAGVFIHIAIQTILNIAVALNVIPNTGVTLPFISYGGTSLTFLLAEVGIVLSVRSRTLYTWHEEVNQSLK